MSQAEINYAGVDWLTATTRADSIGGVWWSAYKQYRAIAAAEGSEERPFNNGWYAGLSIGQVRWGYSERLGYIIIASSQAANKLWHKMQPAKHRVSRLDLCVDISLENPLPWAYRAYAERQANADRKIPKCSLIQGTDGGSTMYVGSRQSQQMGRLYDKGIESGRQDKHLLWRLEVEYKKPLAGDIARALSQIEAEELAKAIADTVIVWFAKRDINMLIDSSDAVGVEVRTEARITTNTRRLNWIRSQVGPTAIKLLDQGLGLELCQALGLGIRDIEAIFNVRILPDGKTLL